MDYRPSRPRGGPPPHQPFRQRGGGGGNNHLQQHHLQPRMMNMMNQQQWNAPDESINYQQQSVMDRYNSYNPYHPSISSPEMMNTNPPAGSFPQYPGQVYVQHSVYPLNMYIPEQQPIHTSTPPVTPHVVDPTVTQRKVPLFNSKEAFLMCSHCQQVNYLAETEIIKRDEQIESLKKIAEERDILRAENKNLRSEINAVRSRSQVLEAELEKFAEIQKHLEENSTWPDKSNTSEVGGGKRKQLSPEAVEFSPKDPVTSCGSAVGDNVPVVSAKGVIDDDAPNTIIEKEESGTQIEESLLEESPLDLNEPSGVPVNPTSSEVFGISGEKEESVSQSEQDNWCPEETTTQAEEGSCRAEESTMQFQESNWTTEDSTIQPKEENWEAEEPSTQSQEDNGSSVDVTPSTDQATGSQETMVEKAIPPVADDTWEEDITDVSRSASDSKQPYKHVQRMPNNRGGHQRIAGFGREWRKDDGEVNNESGKPNSNYNYRNEKNFAGVNQNNQNYPHRSSYQRHDESHRGGNRSRERDVPQRNRTRDGNLKDGHTRDSNESISRDSRESGHRGHGQWAGPKNNPNFNRDDRKEPYGRNVQNEDALGSQWQPQFNKQLNSGSEEQRGRDRNQRGDNFKDGNSSRGQWAGPKNNPNFNKDDRREPYGRNVQNVDTLGSQSHSHFTKQRNSGSEEPRGRDRNQRGDHFKDGNSSSSFNHSNRQNQVKDIVKPDIKDIVKEFNGNLFSAPADFSLAHCVAKDFRMGSGIAVEFKSKFKRVGELLDQNVDVGGCAYLTDNNRYVFYLVTKAVSNGKPTYETLRKSLNSMKNLCERFCVTKLAMPRIGCGLDKLDWFRVKHEINQVFQDTGIDLQVYEFNVKANYYKKKHQCKNKNNQLYGYFYKRDRSLSAETDDFGLDNLFRESFESLNEKKKIKHSKKRKSKQKKDMTDSSENSEDKNYSNEIVLKSNIEEVQSDDTYKKIKEKAVTSKKNSKNARHQNWKVTDARKSNQDSDVAVDYNQSSSSPKRKKKKH